MGKRFRWRLETVKQAKEREEDRRKQSLANAQRELQAAQENLERLRSLKREQSEKLKAKQTGHLDPRDMAATHVYMQNLDEKITAQQQIVNEAAGAVDGRREDLIKAVQENRVLEKLREKDRDVHQREERRKEQSNMDETANTRSARSRRES